MERSFIQSLVDWKNKARRKPLILRGARQVGKTWGMKHFAQTCYDDSVYVSFDNNVKMQEIFRPDLNPRRILKELETLYQRKITPEKTLLIFDEIQELPSALQSLKYFCEEAPEHHIVCAGSLLGIALHPGTSFPVGKVEFLDVAPLSYREFLLALGLDACVELLDAGDLSRLKILKHEFLLALKQYFYVGGMPEAVSVFIETNDFSKTREVQRSIIDMYDQDFSKHAPLVQVPKIRQIWNSVPVQLAKENKKFQYSQLSPGARSREYELALLWLTDTNIVHQVHRVQEIKHPLNAYEDSASFKLYAVDIGLLACMSGLDKDVLFEGDRFFVEFKGSLAEQFVLQELISLSGADPTYKPFYWTNAGGKAEVDFIISVGKHIIPIEVKSGINLRAKSLQVYMQKYEPALALRCSPADYKAGGHITDLPLYALDRLPPECGR